MESEIKCFKLLVYGGIEDPVEIRVHVLLTILVRYGDFFSVFLQLEGLYFAEFFQRNLQYDTVTRG